jgi:diguanylate cyclase (GGDEF)-like protein
MDITITDHNSEEKHPVEILLIEDNDEEALLIQEMLGVTRRFFFHLKRAGSLGEGLSSLGREKPDVILTDLCLPDSRGYDTFRQLAQYAKDLPVILLTNLDDEALGLQAIREGAQDYLVKTELSAALLAKTIRYAIERKRIELAALHDVLTGLPNRALFLDRLERAIQHTKRYTETLYAILCLDLDRFELVNNSLGRPMGDQLLVIYARKLESCLRSEDTVSRFGGDEFVVLLQDIHQDRDAIEVAERILGEFLRPVELDGHRVVISASIGIVLGEAYYDRPEDILRDADIALHQAKVMGKACYVRFEAKMRQRVITRLELENDLRQALENQELQVHYQPIVSLQSWQIVGFEALMRWKHPRQGFIPPKEFIPIAEEIDLIHTLGLWILRQACEQVHSWNNQYNIKPPLTIHVNVSGKQFGRPDFAERVLQVLLEVGLDPHDLSLEITESLFVEDDERFNATLARLCNLGIKLHIDDFGTGYSSFAYLQRLPVSSIKIDASFVMGMQSNSNHAEIVNSIVSLAGRLGMKAIAEGVETETQLDQLKTLNCPFGQGFYISEPVPAQVGQQLVYQSRQTGRLRSSGAS